MHLGGCLAPRQMQLEMATPAVDTQICGPDISLLAQPIGHVGATELRQQLRHDGVVNTKHRQPIERQLVNELDEGLLQTAELAAVSFQVVRIDVGDHGHERHQMQK